MAITYYVVAMKLRSYRLPDKLVDEIEAEARRRKVSASEIARERLSRPSEGQTSPPSLDAISDLIGSIDDLPPDLSRRTKEYLRAGYGRKRNR
jgi:hypothetical protein